VPQLLRSQHNAGTRTASRWPILSQFLLAPGPTEKSGEGSAEVLSVRRILSLSDIVFGLALSIGALTMIGHQPSSTQQFGFSLAVYGFSFMILMSVWRVYSRLTSLLPTEDSVLVGLNILLLFVVSVEPYLFNELFSAKGALLQSVSSVFAIDLALMFFILAIFSDTVATEERHLVSTKSLPRYRFERNRDLLVALMFCISVIPYLGQKILLTFTTGGSVTDLSIRDIILVAALVVSYSSRLLLGRLTTRYAEQK